MELDYEEKLKILYKECINELKNIKIDVYKIVNGTITIGLAKRSCKRYGCCKKSNPDINTKYVQKIRRKRYIRYAVYKNYDIEISKWVMELDDYTIKNTIIHELIHCFPGCDNHGENFKKYSNYINYYLNYDISRTGDKKKDLEKNNIKVEKEKYNYKIICSDCGYTFYRKRLIKYFTRKYVCGKCKR